MRQRLARLGVTDVGVISPSGAATELAAIAGALRGRTLLVDADLLVSDACLGQLVDDPGLRSGALVAARSQAPRRAAAVSPEPVAVGAAGVATEQGSEAAAGGRAVAAPAGARRSARDDDAEVAVRADAGRATPVRAAHGRIVSAGSAVHEVTDATGVFLGALVVDEGDRDDAAKVLAAAADSARFAGWEGDPIDVALVTLVRGQVPMTSVLSVGPVLRGGSEEQRESLGTQLESLDEDATRLERVQRPDDRPFARFVLGAVSKPVTALALKMRLSPTWISLLSLLLGLSAAACFGWGTRPGLVAGALLLQGCAVLGRVGGEVARFTRSTDTGRWLDAAVTPVVEYGAYAGLAIGAARSGVELWLLATLAMAVQAVRHLGDRGFASVQRVRESWIPDRPLLDAQDGFAPDAGLSARAPGGSASWARGWSRAVALPVEERWLLLGVGAFTVGPRWTFLLLITLGAVALVATTAGRVVLSRQWGSHKPAPSGRELLGPLLDLGPLGEPLWNLTVARVDPLARSLGWLWPMALRIAEFGVAWWVVSHVAPAQGAWLFAWTLVVALHHHDLLYRVLDGAAPPRWLSWFGLGCEGRTVLLLLAGWSGAAAVGGVLHVGTPWLALLFVVVSPVQWLRFVGRRARRAAAEPAAVGR